MLPQFALTQQCINFDYANSISSLFVALILVIMGAMPVCAQTIQAKGKVIDSEGKALAGVSVSAKQDKALHTTTASDGTFSIQVAEKTTLSLL